MRFIRLFGLTLRAPPALVLLAFVAGYALYQRWFWDASMPGVTPGRWDLAAELVYSPYLFGFVVLPIWLVFALAQARQWQLSEWLLRAGSRFRALRYSLIRAARTAALLLLASAIVVVLCGTGTPVTALGAPQTAAGSLRDLGLTPLIGTIGQVAACAVFLGVSFMLVVGLTQRAGSIAAAAFAALLNGWVIASNAGVIPAGPVSSRAVLDLREIVTSPTGGVTLSLASLLGVIVLITLNRLAEFPPRRRR